MSTTVTVTVTGSTCHIRYTRLYTVIIKGNLVEKLPSYEVLKMHAACCILHIIEFSKVTVQ